MPFIAIALAVSLFLGGSAVVAQTPQAHSAAAHAAHAWDFFEAKVTGHERVDADTTATSTTQVQGGLRVRSDADADAKAADDRANGNASSDIKLNADGSLKVNVF
ncbi:MAG TPA: hypothetical protein VHD31_02815 [Candidatus Paceibacterota bacterium]|nr:hypothetical protein [Candidatus Paceibacterota bacterium]